MIRVGVVGAGYWGSKHVRVLHDLQDADLTMVCDLQPARLQAIERSYPRVRTTSDYEELLDNVDAVVIATAVDTHYPLAHEAIAAGKHVLVEKPLTADLAAAQRLVQAADAQGVVLMVGHTYQYHPTIEFLRDYLATGALGDLYYIDSARLNLGEFRQDVDVIWDLAPHDVSILLYLLNQDPVWVSARATAHVNPAQHEVAYLSLGFPDKVLAHVHVSWLDPCKVRRLTLVGGERMAVFDEMAPEGQLRIYNKGAFMRSEAENDGFPAVQYRHGEIRAPFIPASEPLAREDADFIASITEGTRPRSDGAFALRVISILEAAHESLARGGEQVDLSPVWGERAVLGAAPGNGSALGPYVAAGSPHAGHPNGNNSKVMSNGSAPR